MKKAVLIFSTLTLVVFITGSSRAENKTPKLIAVKPVYNQASYEPQDSGPAPNLDGQNAEPAPRDQMYIFWLLGKMISYPIDKVESYLSKKLYSAEKPHVVPAAAPTSGSAFNPFDSLNQREIPPAPPVKDKNVHNR